MVRKRIKPYARRKPGGLRKEVSVRGHNKNLTYTQIKRKGIRISKHGDADKDGVKNYKDCRPFDPKKQGWLHDQKMKLLKKEEEFYERRREKEQKKLEDLKDELKIKNKITQAKYDKKKAIYEEKKARVDEITREKKKIQQIKESNRKMKAELEKHSTWGKLKRGATYLGKAGARGASVLAKNSAKALKEADKALSSRPKTRRRKKRR